MHAIVSQFHVIKKMKCKRCKLINLFIIFLPACRLFICHLEDTHFNWIVSPFMNFVRLCVREQFEKCTHFNYGFSTDSCRSIEKMIEQMFAAFFQIICNTVQIKVKKIGKRRLKRVHNWIEMKIESKIKIRMRDGHNFEYCLSRGRWLLLLLVIIINMSSAAQPIAIDCFCTFSFLSPHINVE